MNWRSAIWRSAIWFCRSRVRSSTLRSSSPLRLLQLGFGLLTLDDLLLKRTGAFLDPRFELVQCLLQFLLGEIAFGNVVPLGYQVDDPSGCIAQGFDRKVDDPFPAIVGDVNHACGRRTSGGGIGDALAQALLGLGGMVPPLGLPERLSDHGLAGDVEEIERRLVDLDHRSVRLQNAHELVGLVEHGAITDFVLPRGPLGGLPRGNVGIEGKRTALVVIDVAQGGRIDLELDLAAAAASQDDLETVMIADFATDELVLEQLPLVRLGELDRALADDVVAVDLEHPTESFVDIDGPQGLVDHPPAFGGRIDDRAIAPLALAQGGLSLLAAGDVAGYAFDTQDVAAVVAVVLRTEGHPDGLAVVTHETGFEFLDLAAVALDFGEQLPQGIRLVEKTRGIGADGGCRFDTQNLADRRRYHDEPSVDADTEKQIEKIVEDVTGVLFRGTGRFPALGNEGAQSGNRFIAAANPVGPPNTGNLPPVPVDRFDEIGTFAGFQNLPVDATVDVGGLPAPQVVVRIADNPVRRAPRQFFESLVYEPVPAIEIPGTNGCGRTRGHVAKEPPFGIRLLLERGAIEIRWRVHVFRQSELCILHWQTNLFGGIFPHTRPTIPAPGTCRNAHK